MENQPQPMVAMQVPQPKKKSVVKDVLTNNLSSIYTPFEQPTTVYAFGIIAFWLIIVSYLWMTAPVLIPGPEKVGLALKGFMSDSEFYADIFASVILTSKAMFYSIILSCLLAYLSVTPIFRPVANLLVKLRFMSLIGLVFTFTLLLHAGDQVKLSLLMFGIVPFFTLSLLSVISRIPQKEFDLWTTLKYSRWEQVWHIIIRGKADYTIEAIRANFAMGWLMITMVESFSMSEGGLGVMLFRANKYNQLDKIFAIQLVILALGMLFDFLLKQARYAAFPHVKISEKK
jgi:ABC-type nitrate/sulfonate/bicarbonate transport system permease component